MSVFSHIAYISLGSNSRDAGSMLAKARASLGGLGKVDAYSQIYETEPQDYAEQPWFLNQVGRILLECSWSPQTVLKALLEMETSLGRKRGAIRFGPRNIDLDLLLFDNVVCQETDCLLPHPRLHQRAFVLVPLREIAPELVVAGKPLEEHLQSLRWRRDGARIYQKPE